MNHSLHILLIAPAIQDYSVEYANAVSGRAKVTVIAPRRWFESYAPFFEPSIDLRLVDWPRHSSLRNPAFILQLVRLIHSLRPDVVHVLDASVIWLSLAVPALQRYGLITTMHDVSYHPGDRSSRRVPRQFTDWLVNRSDRLIVHGESLRAEAEQKYPRLRGRIAVLPHLQLQRYLTIARRDGLQRRADPALNVLFFGRIFAYKGLDVLIRAVPLVTARFDRMRVIVAGEGESLDSYRALIADERYFDIRNRHIPDDETAQLFMDADIVVLPYVEASQSGVLAIAQAFGKPVIVTDVGELGHSVTDGVTGLVVPPRDEAALAEAMLLLANDAALRMRLGEAGRSAAENSASAAHVADCAITLYAAIR